MTGTGVAASGSAGHPCCWPVRARGPTIGRRGAGAGSNGERERISGVAYDEVGAQYFEVRGLRRYAGVGSLWALGVGAVISGDFFGWNFGLAAGGFGGLLVATVVITALYAGLCFSIAEMCAALPHTGGAYSFARSAMGPWGGYVTGLAENMEYILTPAVIVVGIGGYLGAITGTPEEQRAARGGSAPTPCSSGSTPRAWRRRSASPCSSPRSRSRSSRCSTRARSRTSTSRNTRTCRATTRGSRAARAGVLAALPFAIWFYLAIEQLPLAAEEAHAPERDLPRGLRAGPAHAGGVLVPDARALRRASRRAPRRSGAATSRCSRTCARSSARASARGRSGSSRSRGSSRASTRSCSPTGARSSRSRARVISRAGSR